MVYTEMLQEKQPCDKIGKINGKILINIVFFFNSASINKSTHQKFCFSSSNPTSNATRVFRWPEVG